MSSTMSTDWSISDNEYESSQESDYQSEQDGELNETETLAFLSLQDNVSGSDLAGYERLRLDEMRSSGPSKLCKPVVIDTGFMKLLDERPEGCRLIMESHLDFILALSKPNVSPFANDTRVLEGFELSMSKWAKRMHTKNRLFPFNPNGRTFFVGKQNEVQVYFVVAPIIGEEYETAVVDIDGHVKEPTAMRRDDADNLTRHIWRCVRGNPVFCSIFCNLPHELETGEQCDAFRKQDKMINYDQKQLFFELVTSGFVSFTETTRNQNFFANTSIITLAYNYGRDIFVDLDENEEQVISSVKELFDFQKLNQFNFAIAANVDMKREDEQFGLLAHRPSVRAQCPGATFYPLGFTLEWGNAQSKRLPLMMEEEFKELNERLKEENNSGANVVDVSGFQIYSQIKYHVRRTPTDTAFNGKTTAGACVVVGAANDGMRMAERKCLEWHRDHQGETTWQSQMNAVRENRSYGIRLEAMIDVRMDLLERYNQDAGYVIRSICAPIAEESGRAVLELAGFCSATDFVDLFVLTAKPLLGLLRRVEDQNARDHTARNAAVDKAEITSIAERLLSYQLSGNPKLVCVGPWRNTGISVSLIESGFPTINPEIVNVDQCRINWQRYGSGEDKYSCLAAARFWLGKAMFQRVRDYIKLYVIAKTLVVNEDVIERIMDGWVDTLKQDLMDIVVTNGRRVGEHDLLQEWTAGERLFTTDGMRILDGVFAIREAQTMTLESAVVSLIKGASIQDSEQVCINSGLLALCNALKPLKRHNWAASLNDIVKLLDDSMFNNFEKGMIQVRMLDAMRNARLEVVPWPQRAGRTMSMGSELKFIKLVDSGQRFQVASTEEDSVAATVGEATTAREFVKVCLKSLPDETGKIVLDAIENGVNLAGKKYEKTDVVYILQHFTAMNPLHRLMAFLGAVVTVRMPIMVPSADRAKLEEPASSLKGRSQLFWLTSFLMFGVLLSSDHLQEKFASKLTSIQAAESFRKADWRMHEYLGLGKRKSGVRGFPTLKNGEWVPMTQAGAAKILDSYNALIDRATPAMRTWPLAYILAMVYKDKAGQVLEDLQVSNYKQLLARLKLANVI